MLEHGDCLNVITNLFKNYFLFHTCLCVLYISALTLNRTHVHATCIYLYIILLLFMLSLLSYSTLVNIVGCYKGELPETFSIQVDMRRVAFYVSNHQLFISFGGGGRERQYSII